MSNSIVMQDFTALDTLIPMHAGIRSKILDCSYGSGKIWDGTTIKPTKKMDIESRYQVDVVADFCRMPFDSESFDVVVFDPPNDFFDFDSFLKEAARVLVLNGIVIAKINDVVFKNRYYWRHIDLINAASRFGFTPCDLLIKINKTVKIKRFGSIKHARIAHSFYVVLRNSDWCCR